MRRLLPAALALVGAVLLGGWSAHRPDDGFGAVAVPVATVPPVVPSTATVPGPAAPEVGRRPAAPAPVPARPGPVRVRLPALGVDAPVVAVGVRGDGRLEVPADGAQVGWYRWSAAPGAPGATVLAGHVDTLSEGPGALYALADVEAGAAVVVDLDDGTQREFRVTARQSFAKADLPVADVFRRGGPATLVLVTCGGPFDTGARSYEQNVVVTAEPVS